MYHRVEYGHCTSDNRLKPFLSTRVVNKDGMVEVESHSHLRRVKVEEQLKAAKETGNKELEDQCKSFLGKYNLDKKYYVNAIDLQGNVGLFKMGHKTKVALEAEITRLRKDGIDPLSADNGRFFVFGRTPNGRDSLFSVVEYKQSKTVDIDGVQTEVGVPFPHAINEEMLKKLGTYGFELNKLYPTITADEEKRIIEKSAKAVDEILGNRNRASNGGSTVNTTPTAQTNETPVAETVQTTAPTPVETLVSTTQEAPVEAVHQTTTPTDVSNMSSDEFFKMVNDK